MTNMSTTIKELAGATTLKNLPPTLNIPANSEEVIFTHTLNSSEINIGKNSNLTFVALINKGWQETQTLNFNFKNKGATLNFLALIIGTDEETFAFTTFSNHTTTNTNAYYTIRSALFDKSKIDYKGNLIIKAKAQITDSYLAHHSLMLSKDAKVETIPSLEIEADDVKAGHAATMSAIDDEMLFYLSSRGLDKRTAKQLLIRNFFEIDLGIIPDEDLRQKISAEIEKNLEQHAQTTKNV